MTQRAEFEAPTVERKTCKKCGGIGHYPYEKEGKLINKTCERCDGEGSFEIYVTPSPEPPR